MSRLLNVRKIYAALIIAAVFCAYSFPFTASASIQKVVFLDTVGEQSWAVPGDFNSYDNIVEVIGAGGGGADQNTNDVGGGGGGGGAYARINNINLVGTTSVFVIVGTGGAVNANAGGSAGTATIFNRTTGGATTCTAAEMSVCASAGTGGNLLSGAGKGIGGSATTSIGSITYAGGGGGAGNTTGDTNGGGGGAGGPNSNGEIGGDSLALTAGGGGGGGGANGGSAGKTATSTTGAPGGNGRSGTGGGPPQVSGTAGTGGGGGGSSGAANGGNGATDAVWDSTHGPGGGGGGGTDAAVSAGAAGVYGGGGGAGRTATAGGNGLIVITYYVPSRSLKLTGTLKLYGGKMIIHQDSL